LQALVWRDLAQKRGIDIAYPFDGAFTFLVPCLKSDVETIHVR
jgi:hypothetical protein